MMNVSVAMQDSIVVADLAIATHRLRMVAMLLMAWPDMVIVVVILDALGKDRKTAGSQEAAASVRSLRSTCRKPRRDGPSPAVQ